MNSHPSRRAGTLDLLDDCIVFSDALKLFSGPARAQCARHRTRIAPETDFIRGRQIHQSGQALRLGERLCFEPDYLARGRRLLVLRLSSRNVQHRRTDSQAIWVATNQESGYRRKRISCLLRPLVRVSPKRIVCFGKGTVTPRSKETILADRDPEQSDWLSHYASAGQNLHTFQAEQ